MPSTEKPFSQRIARSLAPFFAVVALAGAADALVLVHAHDLLAVYMTGNTTKLASALSEGLWSHARPLVCIIVTFFVATTLSAWIARQVGAWRPTAILSITALGLAAAACVAGEEYSLATICLIAVAMGAVNQVRADQSGVTFITGTLVSAGRQVADGKLKQATASLLRWLSFLAGAFVGALLDVALKSAALAVLAGVAAVFALTCAIPVFRNVPEE